MVPVFVFLSRVKYTAAEHLGGSLKYTHTHTGYGQCSVTRPVNLRAPLALKDSTPSGPAELGQDAQRELTRIQ